MVYHFGTSHRNSWRPVNSVLILARSSPLNFSTFSSCRSRSSVSNAPAKRRVSPATLCPILQESLRARSSVVCAHWLLYDDLFWRLHYLIIDCMLLLTNMIAQTTVLYLCRVIESLPWEMGEYHNAVVDFKQKFAARRQRDCEISEVIAAPELF